VSKDISYVKFGKMKCSRNPQPFVALVIDEAAGYMTE
jgi:hypothetical protein